MSKIDYLNTYYLLVMMGEEAEQFKCRDKFSASKIDMDKSKKEINYR